MKAIYIRTSTKEQEPQNQIKDSSSLFEGEDYIIYQDKQTAWKDNVEREQFNKLKSDIAKKKINELYVWDLDRIYRNRKRLISFFEYCRINNCKVYSFRQAWLERLNEMPEPFNDIMHSLMLQIMGWLAEEESSKKSERIRLAVRKKDNKPTKSYKGNKWGRRTLSKQTINKVLELYNEGKSLNQISKEVYYWNSKNTKKRISLGSVHKIIDEFKRKKPE